MAAKLLFLVRHAKAEEEGSGVSDADRQLTREGREAVRLSSIALRRLGVRLDAILSSPLRRAVETASLLRVDGKPEVMVWDELAPGVDPTILVPFLEAVRDREQVALVGHEPDLGALAGYLLTGGGRGLRIPFRKGAIAAIECEHLPPVSAGTLRWFVTPEQLALMGS